MVAGVQKIGQHVLCKLQKLGQALLFFGAIVIRRPSWKGTKLFWQQCYMVGVLSLLIIVLSALFIGMVLGLQGYHILSRFGAEQALGQLSALSLLRELAPVVTALLFVGRAGSALTAEVGLMKVTEQLASMEMLGVDPLKRIMAPRFWAGQLSLPILTLIFSCVAIYGSYLVGVVWLGVDAGAYWTNMQSAVNFREDVINGLIKSIVFGTVISWIALYQGYTCPPSSEGLAKVTTQTVVLSSLAILSLDFLLTAVMFKGR